MTDGDARRWRSCGQSHTRRRIEAARGYLVLEMPRHALSELSVVQAIERHRFDVARLRGEALRLLGRFHEAATAFARALAERPESLPARMSAAVCYRELGQLGRASAMLEEANCRHPNEPAVLLALSQLMTVAGETDHALAWLDRAVRICPEIAEWAGRHEDFACLATHPHFRRILEEAQCRKAS